MIGRSRRHDRSRLGEPLTGVRFKSPKADPTGILPGGPPKLK